MGGSIRVNGDSPGGEAVAYAVSVLVRIYDRKGLLCDITTMLRHVPRRIVRFALDMQQQCACRIHRGYSASRDRIMIFCQIFLDRPVVRFSISLTAFSAMGSLKLCT